MLVAKLVLPHQLLEPAFYSSGQPADQPRQRFLIDNPRWKCLLSLNHPGRSCIPLSPENIVPD